MTKENKYQGGTIGIIFLHGAGLDGWIWRDVVQDLSLPYIFADHSQLRRSEDAEAKLTDYVELAYQQAQELRVNKILVVAHSIGGVVGGELLKRLGDKAAGFIGICAAIPKPGGNFISTLPFPQKMILPIILKLSGTKPPESAIRSGLCSGLSAVRSDEVVERFQQESVHLYTDKTSNKEIPVLPTFYIRTTQDKEFSVKMEDSMIKNLANAKVYDIASGHMPMLSHPKLVSDHINSIVNDQWGV